MYAAEELQQDACAGQGSCRRCDAVGEGLEIALFRQFVVRRVRPRPPADSISTYLVTATMSVQVLTPVGVLDRDKQLGVVRDLTDIVAAAAGDPTLTERTGFSSPTASRPGPARTRQHRRRHRGGGAPRSRWARFLPTSATRQWKSPWNRRAGRAPCPAASCSWLPSRRRPRSLCFAAAASAPSPLYVVYQKELGF